MTSVPAVIGRILSAGMGGNGSELFAGDGRGLGRFSVPEQLSSCLELFMLDSGSLNWMSSRVCLFDLADRCTVGLEQCFVSRLCRLIFQFLFVRSLTLAQFHRQVCAWCVINEAPRPGTSCVTTLPVSILYNTRPVIIPDPLAPNGKTLLLVDRISYFFQC